MMFLLNEGGKSVFPFYEASHMYGVDGALPSRRNPTRHGPPLSRADHAGTQRLRGQVRHSVTASRVWRTATVADGSHQRRKEAARPSGAIRIDG